MPTFDQIRQSLDVPEVLDNLGIVVKGVRGDEYWASCPMPDHRGEDRNPSFSVNVDKMIYSCFTCGSGGNIVHLVMELEQLSWDQAIQWLTDYSDEILEDDDDAFVQQVEKFLHRKKDRHVEDPLPWYSPRILERWNDSYDWGQRGVSQETANLLQFRYHEEHERESRSVKPYVGPALILPHFFKGNLVGYQERWLDEDRPSWIGKYTNSPDFPKKQTLFGYDKAIEENSVIVVEGVMTYARLIQLGYNAVATFGAGVTKDQWQLLKSWDTVFLSGDNDSAGEKMIHNGIGCLKDHSIIKVISLQEYPAGWDLSDIESDNVLKDKIQSAIPWFLYLQ